MKQADKIVLFFPDVVFIFTQAKSRSLLTETGVHCKWLISAQHRWGQLIFRRNQFRVSAKKNRRKKKIQFISHSWSIQSHLFVGGLYVQTEAAAICCPHFGKDLQLRAVSALDTSHRISHGVVKSAASGWGRCERGQHEKSSGTLKEKEGKKKSHCCHKAKEFRNLGKHPWHFKLERASSWRLSWPGTTHYFKEKRDFAVENKTKQNKTEIHSEQTIITLFRNICKIAVSSGRGLRLHHRLLQLKRRH